MQILSTRLEDGNLEPFPDSKWSYTDLKELEIFYKEDELTNFQKKPQRLFFKKSVQVFRR